MVVDKANRKTNEVANEKELNIFKLLEGIKSYLKYLSTFKAGKIQMLKN